MRYLFGPAPAAFADEYLAAERGEGRCLCLGADVPFAPDDGWADVAARLPAGWAPDLVVVRLPEVGLPLGVWSAPVPVVGLAEGWDRRAHYYRHAAALCDVVLAEPPAAAALAALGCDRVRPADLSGLGRSALEAPPAADRDIDVLVLDDFDPSARRERLAWLGRIAQLADSGRVVIARPGPDARALLARARLVVQPPAFGVSDRPAYEAAAAGAALLRVPAAWDGEDGLRPGVDYLPHDGRNLEALISHLLERPAEYRPVARAARVRVREFGYAARLAPALAAAASAVPPGFVATVGRAGRRSGPAGRSGRPRTAARVSCRRPPVRKSRRRWRSHAGRRRRARTRPRGTSGTRSPSTRHTRWPRATSPRLWPAPTARPRPQTPPGTACGGSTSRRAGRRPPGTSRSTRRPTPSPPPTGSGPCGCPPATRRPRRRRSGVSCGGDSTRCWAG